MLPSPIMALKDKLVKKVAESGSQTTLNQGTDSSVEVINPTTQTEAKVVQLRGSSDYAPMDIVPAFAITLTDAKERIRMLQEFVKDLMVPGQDYGLIPGCPKPSLLKPGAEKLCDIFGFAKHVKVTNRLEDWSNGIFAYEVIAVLINKRTGLVEAEGVGSCNNKEKRYRNQDPYSVINTILKMAKKRALVDAVLSATRSSALFTQDIEDLAAYEVVETTGTTNQAEKPRSNGKSKTGVNKTADPATKSQLKKIFTLAKEINLPTSTASQMIKELYQAEESTQLTKQQASDLINRLLTMKSNIQ